MASYDVAMWLWMALTTGMRRVCQWDGLRSSRLSFHVGESRELARVIPDESMKMSGSLCCMQNKGGGGQR